MSKITKSIRHVAGNPSEFRTGTFPIQVMNILHQQTLKFALVMGDVLNFP
jgi:hypothetical protein